MSSITRLAAIDIGTNTILLLIADVLVPKNPEHQHVIQKVLASELRFARLGEEIRKNLAFKPEAMQRARKILTEYKSLCDKFSVNKIIAVGTSASRNAKNAKEFYSEIKKDLQIEVKIIPGTVEAKLSFLGGLLPNQDPNKYAVMDIGGGSTEFVYLGADKKLKAQSFETGCVTIAEKCLKGETYTPQSLQEMENDLKATWPKMDPEVKENIAKKEWVAVAGTPTTLAGVMQNLNEFEEEKLDGHILERCLVADMYESLALQSLGQRKKTPLITEGRADVIVSGSAILLTAMEYFDKESVIVSSRGLRHGVVQYPNLIS